MLSPVCAGVQRVLRHKHYRLMEQLNRIELRGIVGTVRVQAVGDTHVAKISLATDYIYKGRNGDPVI